MSIVFLSLGSNQGNRIDYLQKSVDEIEMQIGVIVSASSYYETEPWGFSTDSCFINQVICVNTILSPKQVLEKLLYIEGQLGRTRNQSEQTYSNRTIDIDILFYDNQILEIEDLVIPHKYLHSRRFVLEPLNEIAPKMMHPLLKKSVHDFLINCDDKMQVNKYLVEEIAFQTI